jgi:hypothetical protein
LFTGRQPEVARVVDLAAVEGERRHHHSFIWSMQIAPHQLLVQVD